MQHLANGPRLLGDESATPEIKELTKEEFGFRHNVNFITFNENHRLGFLLGSIFFGLLGCLVLSQWSCAFYLFVVLTAMVVWKPIGLLYMGSFFFCATLRTPEFLDPDAHFPQHKHLENQFSAIQKEVRTYLQEKKSGGKELQPTKETYDGQNSYVGSGGTGDKEWRILTIKQFEDYTDGARQDFPTLASVLDELPDVIISCVISVLEPKVKIPMHIGYYKGLMRYMLPITIPKDTENIWLNVNGIKHHWEEGKSMLWDDTYPHAAYNNTEEVRVVLYMDVIRTYNISWTGRCVNRIMSALCKMFAPNDTTKKNEEKVKIN